MPPIEAIDAAPAADVTTAAPSESITTTPAAPALSDDTLGALFDKIQAGPEAPEGDPAPVEPDPADQPKEPDAEPAPVQAIAPPGTWSAEMKARLASLPPEYRDLQEYAAQRESEAHGKISRMGQELSQLKPVGELRTQYQDVFDRNGVTFTDGFHTIMAMQNLLETDSLKGIAAIAETFGIDLHKAFGSPVQQQQTPQPGDAQPQPVNPEFQRLEREITQLKGILTEQQRTQIATQTAEARRLVDAATQEIDAWSKDKSFHEELKPTMAELIKAGVATTLDEARRMALTLDQHSDIRQKIDAADQADKTAKARAQQEKDVAAAKRAAKTNGGNRPARTAPTGKWDSDANLNATFDEITAA